MTKHFLFLGKSGPKFNCYRIRFRIRRKLPNVSELFRRSTECRRSRDSPSVDGRGSLLFALQLVILTVGVIDLCLNVRQRSGAVHLTLAIAEVILTTVQMALRVVSVQTNRAQTIASDLSMTSDGNDVTAELLRMQSRVRKVVTVVGLSLVLVNVLLFPLFHLFVHLGWSHLTNNVFVLCFGRLHDVLQVAVEAEVDRTDQDSNRAVVYEAGQLLEEQFYVRSVEARGVYEESVNRFLVALKNTPCYVKPDYIHLTEGRVGGSVSRSSSQADEETGTPEEHLSCL